MVTIIQRTGSFCNMVDQAKKVEERMRDRDKYLEAKGKYDRLLKHIEDYKQGKVNAEPLLTCIMRTQGKKRFYYAYPVKPVMISSSSSFHIKWIKIN